MVSPLLLLAPEPSGFLLKKVVIFCHQNNRVWARRCKCLCVCLFLSEKQGYKAFWFINSFGIQLLSVPRPGFSHIHVFCFQLFHKVKDLTEAFSLARPLIMSLIPVSFVGLLCSRLECMVSLLYMTVYLHETCRNVRFYHWGRNLSSWASCTNAVKFLGGNLYSITPRLISGT